MQFAPWILQENQSLRTGIPYESLVTLPTSRYSSLLPFQVADVRQAYRRWFPDGVQTVIDATAHIGVDTLCLQQAFPRAHLQAYEKDPAAFACLRQNVPNVTLHCEDAVSLLTQDLRHVGLVYLDPPWGGHEYKNHVKMQLTLANHPILQFKDQLLRNGAQAVVIKVPINFDFGPYTDIVPVGPRPSYYLTLYR